MQHIMKCPECGQYTLEFECSKCNVKTVMPRPAKFSLADKYAKYRRLAKKSLNKSNVN